MPSFAADICRKRTQDFLVLGRFATLMLESVSARLQLFSHPAQLLLEADSLRLLHRLELVNLALELKVFSQKLIDLAGFGILTFYGIAQVIFCPFQQGQRLGLGFFRL